MIFVMKRYNGYDNRYEKVKRLFLGQFIFHPFSLGLKIYLYPIVFLTKREKKKSVKYNQVLNETAHPGGKCGVRWKGKKFFRGRKCV
jgi:hypothetical protein